jgi:anti-sigma factor ChrR (cupin superfamily)
MKPKLNVEQMIDVDVEAQREFAAAVDESIAIVPLSAAHKDRLFAKISAQLNTPTIAAPTAVSSIRTLAASKGAWHRLNSEIEVKVLADDGNMRSFLMRVAAGGSIPDHTHDHAEEECLVLDGEVVIDGELLKAGDYQISPKGSHHRSLHSEGGCLLFLRGSSHQVT